MIHLFLITKISQGMTDLSLDCIEGHDDSCGIGVIFLHYRLLHAVVYNKKLKNTGTQVEGKFSTVHTLHNTRAGK
jgi:hypothetical protein